MKPNWPKLAGLAQKKTKKKNMNTSGIFSSVCVHCLQWSFFNQLRF